MLEDKIIEGLLEKMLARETDSAKALIDMRILLERILFNLIKINAALNKLNLVSGANPVIESKEIERELAMVRNYSQELKNRMTQLALEEKEKS